MADAIAALLLGLTLMVAGGNAWAGEDPLLERATRILDAAPVFDGHNDLPWVIREKFNGNVEGYDISRPAQLDTDLPRLRQGRVGAQFWSVYVPSSLSPVDAVRAQLEQIDITHRMIALYPQDLMLATTVSAVRSAWGHGRIASLIGIEGGHTIVNSLGVLRSYYALGVRYMTLTHYNSTDWADAATEPPQHDGLTEFGEEVVREMNRLGMIVDLSHVSPATMNDALETTQAPVIFSHSSARALTDHVRNVPDSVLKKMAANGGVVMVTFVPSFVMEERRVWEEGMMPLLANASTDAQWVAIGRAFREEHGVPPIARLEHVADHIDHVARVAGMKHVGIGGDFYGATGDELVKGLEDVSRYPQLIAELLKRGWSEEDLAGLTQNNVLRVFAEVETVAAKLQRSSSPSLKTLAPPPGEISD